MRRKQEREERRRERCLFKRKVCGVDYLCTYCEERIVLDVPLEESAVSLRDGHCLLKRALSL